MNPLRIVSICLGVIALVGVLAVGLAPTSPADGGESPMDVQAEAASPLPDEAAAADSAAAAAAAASSDFDGWVDSAPADDMPADDAPADESGGDSGFGSERSAESAPADENSSGGGMAGEEMSADE